MSISNDWYPWKKTDCKWFYDFYRNTRYGAEVDYGCIKHQFTCNGCKEYVKE